MSELEKSINSILEYYIDPLKLCAEQPTIAQSSFDAIATEVSSLIPEKSIEELTEVLNTYSKRYSACGGNFSDRYAVIRKSKKSGWIRLISTLTA